MFRKPQNVCSLWFLFTIWTEGEISGNLFKNTSLPDPVIWLHSELNRLLIPAEIIIIYKKYNVTASHLYG